MSPDGCRCAVPFMVVLKCRPGSADAQAAGADFFPEIARLQRLGHFLLVRPIRHPKSVGLHRAQKNRP